MAAIEYRGLNAVTNFDLSRYIKWLKPAANHTSLNPTVETTLPSSILTAVNHQHQQHNHDHHDRDQFNLSFFNTTQSQMVANGPSCETTTAAAALLSQQPRSVTATSALGLLLQSSKFKEMMEMTTSSSSTSTSSAVDCVSTPPPPLMEFEPDQHQRVLQCSFPEDIQTFFGGEGDDDIIFGELNSFVPQMFQCSFDA